MCPKLSRAGPLTSCHLTIMAPVMTTTKPAPAWGGGPGARQVCPVGVALSTHEDTRSPREAGLRPPGPRGVDGAAPPRRLRVP